MTTSIFINCSLQPLQTLAHFSVTFQQSTQTTRPAGPQSPLDTNLGKPAVAAAKPSCHAHLQDLPVKSSHLHHLGLEEDPGWPAEAGEVAQAPLVPPFTFYYVVLFSVLSYFLIYAQYLWKYSALYTVFLKILDIME